MQLPQGSPRRQVILLVDDDPHDVVLIRLALRKVGIIDAIHLVKNGAEAMAYLRGDGPYSNRKQFALPTLVLLDLKMPQTSGFEVLRWVRLQAEFSLIQVVVMSASNQRADIQQAYALGANLYLVKPSKFADLVTMMDSLKAYDFTGTLAAHPAAAPRGPVAREGLDSPGAGMAPEAALGS